MLATKQLVLSMTFSKPLSSFLVSNQRSPGCKASERRNLNRVHFEKKANSCCVSTTTSIFIDFCVSRMGDLNIHPFFFLKLSGFVLNRDIMVTFLSSVPKQRKMISSARSPVSLATERPFSTDYLQAFNILCRWRKSH